MAGGWKERCFNNFQTSEKRHIFLGTIPLQNADIAENQLDAQNPANQLTWYIPSIDCRFHRSKLLKILFMNSTPITSWHGCVIVYAGSKYSLSLKHIKLRKNWATQVFSQNQISNFNGSTYFLEKESLSRKELETTSNEKDSPGLLNRKYMHGISCFTCVYHTTWTKS